jgi:hypothetical protein
LRKWQRNSAASNRIESGTLLLQRAVFFEKRHKLLEFDEKVEIGANLIC